MPELPEVETVRRQLDMGLRGRRILDVEIWKTGREKPAGLEHLVGRTIDSVDRRAKLLVLRLDDGSALTAHLKMTGKFVFVDENYEPNKHDRILFICDGKRLVWSDIRKFGFLHHVSAKELGEILASYGPEPLESSIELLASRIIKPKTRSIKAALLNQQVIAGIGNIYADEACHRAGLRPTRTLGSLSLKDREAVMCHAKEILTEAVAQRGTSANDYVDTKGEKGGFLGFLRVYGRTGEPCRMCNSSIKKMLHKQRGTHFCPTCQI